MFSCRYRQENVTFATILLIIRADKSMDYVSTKEYAESHGLAERTIRNYCVQGKMRNAILVGKSWSIPADAPLPERKNARRKMSPLLQILKEQKERM